MLCCEKREIYIHSKGIHRREAVLHVFLYFMNLCSMHLHYTLR